MTTYLELKQKAEKLMAEAEQLREKEIEEVIADIKNKIAAYGLTASDLGLRAASAKPGRPRAAAKGRAPAKSKGKVKYRGPNGETWSGGRGRKPAWVQQILKSGKKIEDYAV